MLLRNSVPRSERTKVGSVRLLKRHLPNALRTSACVRDRIGSSSTAWDRQSRYVRLYLYPHLSSLLGPSQSTDTSCQHASARHLEAPAVTFRGRPLALRQTKHFKVHRWTSSFIPAHHTERDRIWKVRSAERCPPRAPWCAWLKHARLHVSPFGAANPPGITAAQTFSPVWRTTDHSRRPSPATLNGSPCLRKCPARELSLRWPSYQALRREPVTENSLTPAESRASAASSLLSGIWSFSSAPSLSERTKTRDPELLLHWVRTHQLVLRCTTTLNGHDSPRIATVGRLWPSLTWIFFPISTGLQNPSGLLLAKATRTFFECRSLLNPMASAATPSSHATVPVTCPRRTTRCSISLGHLISPPFICQAFSQAVFTKWWWFFQFTRSNSHATAALSALLAWQQ